MVFVGNISCFIQRQQKPPEGALNLEFAASRVPISRECLFHRSLSLRDMICLARSSFDRSPALRIYFEYLQDAVSHSVKAQLGEAEAWRIPLGVRILAGTRC